MNKHTNKTQKNSRQSVAHNLPKLKSKGASTFQFEDNRPEAVQMRALQEIVNDSHQLKQPGTYQAMANSHSLKARQLSAATAVIQRQLLPAGRHREIVKDAAKRLKDPVNATYNQWVHAVYEELEGIGHPATNNCVAKLIEQRIIDQNDWELIERDFMLYKSGSRGALDLHERHNTPPVHSEEEADKWVASLITGRINELYSTLPGFGGHAHQVQLAITSLVGWYKEDRINKDAYEKYKAKIISALNTGKNRSNLAIPKYLYTFEDGSVKAV